MSKENYRILVVDDEKSVLLLLKRIIEDEGYTVKTAGDGSEALRIAERVRPHLIITDLKMPLMDGLTLMERYRESDADTDFMILTAHGTVETALKSMKMGALDYILKPLKEPDELRLAIGKAFERRRLLDENLALRSEFGKDIPPDEVLFAGMEDLLHEARAVARTGSTVLLLGETGTGKNLIAKVIHRISGRRGPCVEINCSSVPENLLESEFFGHEKGAFTGALTAKRGKFELASGGTIFLDEIAEMDARLQAKLLRVLQDGTFERVGSTLVQKTDARFLCATNRDLQKEIREGRFREDLFFRLNVFPLELKPLRHRKTALPVIADYLLKSISARIGKPMVRIPEQAMEKILAYPWPGNVRELQNVLERAIILSRGEDLALISVLSGAETPRSVFRGTLKEIQRRAIEDVLEQTGGRRKEAAALLGISLRTLQYKIKEYEIKK